ncbi:MAG: hypothetical protein ABIO84_08125 [Lysobacter sp.]
MEIPTPLRAVLADTDGSWLADFDAALLAPARDSVLGRRLLARTLGAGGAATLLAPAPKPVLTRVLTQWPREKLQSLALNLGVLAFAPVIRAEVARETVRRLKHALDKRYLLALDRQVWDGEVPRELQQRLHRAMHTAMEEAEGAAALLALLGRQGRAELRRWANPRDPALIEWLALLHPRTDDTPVPHLPPAAVQRLYAIHAGN